MGVKADFKEVDDYIRKSIENYEKALIQGLEYVGLNAVRLVRDRSKEESWEDQSGNLRSSIGYVIVKDGKVINGSDFASVAGPKKTDSDVDGSQEGKDYAYSLASGMTRGYTLIVVAGMEYASRVEAMDNKDVLASSEIESIKLAKELLSKIGL